MGEYFKGKVLITIGRESGSGGRKIGLRLAELLGIPCYDKELIKEAAKESGLSEEVLEMHEERPNRSFLYSLVMDPYSIGFRTGDYELPIEQKVFLAQYNAIKEIAKKGSAVFVGRLADYALKDHPDMVSVFITGDYEDKVAHLMETYQFKEDEAKTYLKNTDKRRRSYYNYYSDKKWGSCESYDLTINRSVLGFEGTVKAILSFLELKNEYENK